MRPAKADSQTVSQVTQAGGSKIAGTNQHGHKKAKKDDAGNVGEDTGDNNAVLTLSKVITDIEGMKIKLLKLLKVT